MIIGKRARCVLKEKAMDYVMGYTILLDITARDLQLEAKEKSLPWTVAKGFDTFAPVGPRIVPADELSPENLEIWLRVNGEMRQRGSTGDMILSIPFLISHISRIMTLEPGDIIVTGTPAGVSEIREGNVIEAGIERNRSAERACEKEAIIPLQVREYALDALRRYSLRGELSPTRSILSR